MTILQYTSDAFPITVESSIVDLPQAEIAQFISRPPSQTTATHKKEKLPIVFLIHGNSTSSLFWLPIFKSPLYETHKIVAFDLPGHGASSNAKEEYGLRNVYSQQGYAGFAKTVIESFIENEGGTEKDVVVFGNSLGGHIAIELCNLMMSTNAPSFHIVGLVTNDTSPVSNGNFAEAFVPSELMKYAAAEYWTEDDIKRVAEHMMIGPPLNFILDAFRRTDGRSRQMMFETSLDGSSVCDQKACIEKLTWNGHGSSEPAVGEKKAIVAMINGSEEKTINFQYLHHGINWGPGLWRGKCIEIRGDKPSGHLPFLEDWDGFWPYLRDFIADASRL